MRRLILTDREPGSVRPTASDNDNAVALAPRGHLATDEVLMVLYFLYVPATTVSVEGMPDLMHTAIVTTVTTTSSLWITLWIT